MNSHQRRKRRRLHQRYLEYVSHKITVGIAKKHRIEFTVRVDDLPELRLLVLPITSAPPEGKISIPYGQQGTLTLLWVFKPRTPYNQMPGFRKRRGKPVEVLYA